MMVTSLQKDITMQDSSQQLGVNSLFQMVGSSVLFTDYQSAFKTATGFTLNLQEVGGPVSQSLIPFMQWHHEPVMVCGREACRVVLGPFRVTDGEYATFEASARQMLDDGCSADDLRTAQHKYNSLPTLNLRELNALQTMLHYFAIQLSDHAEKLFLIESDSEPAAVKKARHYILDNLSEPLTLDEVAAHAGVSPFHFCKVFKKATGKTFTDFVNHARIDQAKRLLLKPQSRITEIAYNVGFQSLSQFNRSFRRIASVTPTQYRQNESRTTLQKVAVN